MPVAEFPSLEKSKYLKKGQTRPVDCLRGHGKCLNYS